MTTTRRWILLTFFCPTTVSAGFTSPCTFGPDYSWDSERRCKGCGFDASFGDTEICEAKFLLARNLLCGELNKLSLGRGLYTAGKDILAEDCFKTGDALTKLENLGASSPGFDSGVFLASLSFYVCACDSRMRWRWSSWASRYFFIKLNVRMLSATAVVKIGGFWSAGLNKLARVGSFITFDVFCFFSLGTLFEEDSSSVRDFYY